MAVVLRKLAVVHIFPSGIGVSRKSIAASGTLGVGAVVPVGKVPVPLSGGCSGVQQGLGRVGVGHEPKVEFVVPHACPSCYRWGRGSIRRIGVRRRAGPRGIGCCWVVIDGIDSGRAELGGEDVLTAEGRDLIAVGFGAEEI